MQDQVWILESLARITAVSIKYFAFSLVSNFITSGEVYDGVVLAFLFLFFNLNLKWDTQLEYAQIFREAFLYK